MLTKNQFPSFSCLNNGSGYPPAIRQQKVGKGSDDFPFLFQDFYGFIADRTLGMLEPYGACQGILDPHACNEKLNTCCFKKKRDISLFKKK